jgi:hypothetical protein
MVCPWVNGLDHPIGPAPRSQADGTINLDDILAVLDAFAGLDGCGCP